VTNIFRAVSTKFCKNCPGSVDDVTKTFGVFLGSQFELLFAYKTRTLRSRSSMSSPAISAFPIEIAKCLTSYRKGKHSRANGLIMYVHISYQTSPQREFGDVLCASVRFTELMFVGF